MNIRFRLQAVIFLGLALGGCATHAWLDEPGDSKFGEANRQTMMAQVVNPHPYYPDAMTTSGEQAADAIERYRNESVYEPESIATTNVGAGSN